MIVRVRHRFHASAILREVPAADGFIVRDGEEVFPAGVEGEGADPVVVASESFQEGTPRVPQADGFIS